jgi:hypothetical protein
MLGELGIRMRICALVLAGTSACAPTYDTLDVERVQGSLGAVASDESFAVEEGKVIVFSAKPQSARGRSYEVIDVLELASEEPSVARVEQGLSVGTWMIMGVARGSTMLEVRIDGELEDRIPIDVMVQEVSP